MDIRLLAPAFLFLLGTLPLLWLFPRRLHDRGLGLLRSAVIALLVVALARPVGLADSNEEYQVLVWDGSPSTAHMSLAEATESFLDSLGPQAQPVLVRFGGDGGRDPAVAGGHPVPGADRFTASLVVRAAGSPIAEALTLAARSIPLGARGAITLVSDGLATDRAWGPVVQDLCARGIPIHTTLTPGPAGVQPVSLRPAGPLRVGQTGRLIVDLVGGPAVALVRLGGADGQLAEVPRVQVADRTSVPLEFEVRAAGYQSLAVEVTIPGSPPAILDARLAIQDPLAVLYLGHRMVDGADRIGDLVGPGFRLQDFQDASAIGPLDTYDLVILDDRPLELIPEDLQARLVREVADNGLGLLVAGGRAAFGPGGYQDSILAEILPVEFSQAEEKRDPSIALVVIIDTSGSMTGTRVQLAKEVARLAIRRLLPHDKVGIVEFYGSKRWAAPIQAASNSIELERALNRLDAGGGTVFLPAIEEAFYALRNVQARYKHVLLLTDGGVERGDFEPLLRRMSEAGMNVSTALIGGQAHSDFLVDLANWGRGHFYSVPNRFNLPEVFLKLPTTARLPAYRAGTIAVASQGGPGWWGEVDRSTVPPLAGYVETRSRPGAEDILVTEGQPILSSWRYGLGRVTALMTEPLGAGTSTWRDWLDYGTFLGRVLSRTAADDEPFTFAVRRSDHRLTVTARRGAARPEVMPTARLLQDAGPATPLVFRERSPGVFTAEVVLPPDREARIEAGIEGRETRTRLVSAAYADIAAELQVDPELALDLRALAAATGGQHGSLEELGATGFATGGGDRAVGIFRLWPWCLLLALVTYLGELLYRRTRAR